MNFEEWFEKQDKCHKSLCGFSFLENEKIKMKDGWAACKEEVLKIINKKISKVRGMEGLGGYSWEEMDAEEFRSKIKDKIKKL